MEGLAANLPVGSVKLMQRLERERIKQRRRKLEFPLSSEFESCWAVTQTRAATDTAAASTASRLAANVRKVGTLAVRGASARTAKTVQRSNLCEWREAEIRFALSVWKTAQSSLALKWLHPESSRSLPRRSAWHNPVTAPATWEWNLPRTATCWPYTATRVGPIKRWSCYSASHLVECCLLKEKYCVHIQAHHFVSGDNCSTLTCFEDEETSAFWYCPELQDCLKHSALAPVCFVSSKSQN